MQTGNGIKSEQYLDPDNEPVAEAPVQAGDAGRDEPAISDLLAVAEEFNAAFNTALYGLDTSRKLVNERSARIDELNESIMSLNAALHEEISENRRKDEALARETEALNRGIHELESERDRLRQQTAEQEKSLNEHAGVISGLSSRVAELATSLEAHEADRLRAAEAFAREREESKNSLDVVQGKYDVSREQLQVLQVELEERNGAIAGLSGQVDTLTSEVASLSEIGKRQDEAYREESGRLHAELQALHDALRTKEGLLVQSSHELDSRNTEIASLNNRVRELKDELDAQSAKMREETESHARMRTELNDRISGISGDHESLKVIHNELIAHVEKLENLNRALHDSSTSEHDVHKKIVREKDAAITALQAKLEARNPVQDLSTGDTGADGELRATLNDLETRLKESESQARMFAERARMADELEVRVEHLSRELLISRDSGAEDDTESLALKKTLQDRVIDLESALEQSRSEQEALAARLSDHEALKQEVERLREIVQDAGNKPDAQSGLNATVVSMKNEVERLKEERAASRQSNACGMPVQQQGNGPSPLITDRDRFVSHLNILLAEQRGSGAKHAVMYVLLDNFIRVRDEIGVMNSEQVVEDISGIIESHCDGNDMITRFGDCTFVVLCHGTSTDDTQRKAERIRSTIENHIFEAAGRTLVTSTSIGICAVRGSDSSAEQVISRADLACESARLTGGNQVLVNSAVSDELCVLGNNLKHAEIVDRVLAENRIKIYYQPISNLKDNSINCFEILTRVVDENSDIILPGEFFSMAANSGKAREVDLHVIESVMSMLAKNTVSDMKLFIKLTRQSVSCHDFPLWIVGKIKEYRINPEQLVFEVAERVLESELKNLSMLSRALNKIGCKIAIEHYRLETQSQHLQHIHADYLKIDSELVQNISSKGKFLAKVTEIIDVARNNNLTTIAEGVENPHCLAILWELGVSLAQGYFISEPVGSTNFETHDADTRDEEANHGKATYTLG
jgi:diguanylate cyclase (GGDEF)-like protein